MELVLKVATGPGWLEAVLEDLDGFLIDHASCERKASAMAMSLVAHYPDRRMLVREMIKLAQEELEHFRQVNQLLDARGLMLTHDVKDAYVGGLLKHKRSGREDYFLDRLLIAGIVEARGCERFGMIAEGLPETEADLRAFYRRITDSESRHQGLFLTMAQEYFDDSTIALRLNELLVAEAELIRALPHQPALH